ncbi:pentatricopeptide repeat-containing protein At5g66520-like [Telopea speciosissima]|uniref:pentatricopeptide repeat-containing protein At5g66520-like n=1 Tax=Telopea speciosissima TaxID=54955 RepID=UPI001CC6143B|nr:pentatricopeptide repeat-containing protein At5g66520-like [Telopea speciosissima]
MMIDSGPLVAVIKQCTSLRELKSIQAYMVRAGLTQDAFLASKLIESSALSLTGHLDYAHRIFSWTHYPNLFMWNTLIRGYALSESSMKAISVYRDMHASGLVPNCFTVGFVLKACSRLLRPDEGKQIHSQIIKLCLGIETPVINGLMRFYVSCGDIDAARVLFDEMSERDAGSWSVMVSGYAQHGRPREALAVFREMQFQNVDIDGFTLASIAGVCGDLGALDLGKWLHSYIDRKSMNIDVVLGTSLVDMYAKCGSLNDAMKVFRKMCERDVMAWSAMIGAYAVHGYGDKALNVFAEMKRAKVRPNCVTFTSVLCACSHSGLVEEGCRNFQSMWSDYGIKPQIEHYGCMVDLFCRAGLVSRAHEFIKNMPIEPNVVLWRTLLSACKAHGYAELAEQISRQILELEPQSGESYVLVSNVYASLGKWSSVSKVRSLMKDKKAKKNHGWSSIEVDFTVHEFVMGDESHPEREEIYRMLDQMAKRLKQEGHATTTQDVLHDIDEEEKEHALGLHSERLAIAYGLLRMSEGSPIRIVKNLRVCRDCHEATKLISKIYKREIIIRDRIRFHHFREGKCSCNDYW